MYYPEDKVEEVRSRANIADVIGSYVKLQKKGASYFGLCPFHGEKTPSFSVAPNKQMFYCFGCGMGGDVIKFLMEYENITFAEALKQLADQVGVELPQESDGGDRRDNDIKLKLLEINKLAAHYYYKTLKSEQGKLGYSYLRRRELTDGTITHFGLGYADQRRDSMYQYLKGKGFSDELLMQSGLITFSERGVYDKFFNRVMFPILDFNNRVIGFGGRVMGDGEPKYLNSPETKLFDKSRNLYGLNFAKKARQKFLLLCEGYMDVISLHQAGFQNAVASLGTAFTEQQAQIIKRYVDEVILTYDSDGAGMKAAKRALPILKKAGLQARVLSMKPYKDPDEFIKNLGAEAYQKRIDEARNSFLWEVEILKQSYDLRDPAGQTAYIRAVADMLTGFTEPLERDTYMKAVAREQMIDYESLRRLTNSIGGEKFSLYGKKTYAQTSTMRQKKKSDGGDALLKSQKQLITWLVERPELIELVSKYIQPSDMPDETYRRVAEAVYQQVPATKILDQFVQDQETYQKVAAMFHEKLLSEETDEYEFKRGLEDVIRNIRQAAIDRRIAEETSPAALAKLFQEKAALAKLHL